jgi:hypothetical protein
MAPDLPEGTFLVGKRWFGICHYCSSAVRLDKPIIGSFHLCLPSAEREAIDRRDQDAKTSA